MSNEEVAREFLEYSSECYEDLSQYFNKRYKWEEGLLNEAIIKVHKYVLKYGEKTKTSWKGLIFMSANNLQKDIYRKEKKFNETGYLQYISQQTTTEEKVKTDTLKDFAANELIEIVESKFDSRSFNCWRFYHLIPKITYKKLRELTGLKDAKERVVKINKYLKENVKFSDIVNKYENTFS